MTIKTNSQTDLLKERTKKLKLHGLIEQWNELNETDFT